MKGNNYTQAQQYILNQLKQNVEQLQIMAIMNAGKYVVAGYAGTSTLYCYRGMGYNGVPVCPANAAVTVFETLEQAKKLVKTTNCKNGFGLLIELKVMRATEYFDILCASSNRALLLAKAMMQVANEHK